MLQIDKINKKYITGDLVQTALNDVSLNLRDNELVAILGPSGSGKTTLLIWDVVQLYFSSKAFIFSPLLRFPSVK